MSRALSLLSLVLYFYLYAHTYPGARAGDLYRAVRLAATPLSNESSNLYLLIRNRLARLINDEDTLELLDPTALPDEIHSLVDLHTKYEVGEPLPRIAYNSKPATPDDCIRVYALKSSVLNGDDLFIDWTHIGEYMNPSVLVFRGRLLVVTPLQVGITGSEHRKATGTIEFKWLNSTRYPFHTAGDYLGISNEVHMLNELFVGEDPRALYFNDSYFQIYYTYTGRWIGRNHQKMGVADIRYLDDERRINITYLASPIIGKHPIDNGINQKNWSPFVHRGQVFLIQSIHPFTVVQLHGYGTPDVVATVNATVYYEIATKLGEYRGGTNAILLPDKKTYLAFYHLRTRLPWNSMTSYLYGAYTFTAEPAFAMLKISPTPIVEPRQLYSGAWASRYIDYCVYPMHIYLDANASDVLHISLGYQDHFGIIAEMNLTRLLDTLVSI